MNKKVMQKCADCSYRGRHIYAVGTSRFERGLLTHFIDTYTAARWFEVDSIDEVPLRNEGGPLKQKLILLDAHLLRREDLLALFTSNLWKLHSHQLIALFNLHHDLDIEKEALKNGVRGFLYLDDSPTDLLNGICALNSGDLWISRRIMSQCLQESYIGKSVEDSSSSLSEREVEILRELVTGASNEAIADRLYISPHTVKTHLHNIFKKIDVTNRLQAVLWAEKKL